jgi:cytochrome c biogenesis protein
VNVILYFASLKFTLIGMLLLASGSMLIYGGDKNVSIWVVTVPLLLMALNLLCAIVTNRKINRQSGLLIFHLGLLALVLLIAVGRLTHLDAQLEMTVGQRFNEGMLSEVKHGPLHLGDFSGISFIQGPYSVAYEPGLQRGPTSSHVRARMPDGTESDLVVGDDTPLIFGDYRLYTSFNKGFSVLLEWMPNQGASTVGSVNMPSFPLNDYKQKNEWTPPGSNEVVKFWLRLDTPYDENGYWVLQKETSSGVLVVTVGDERVELEVGDSLQLNDGKLVYRDLSMWMGYTIFYDPTLRWLFFVSVIAVLGLGWHFWKKMEVAMQSESDESASQTTAEDK